MNEIKTLLRLNITEQYNAWVFYLQRLPFLKVLFSDRLYRADGFVNFLLGFSLLLGLGKHLVSGGFYLFIVHLGAGFLASALAMLHFPHWDAGFLYLFTLSLLTWCGTLMDVLFIMPSEREDVLMIKGFRVDPFRYYQVAFFVDKGLWLLTRGLLLSALIHWLPLGTYFATLPPFGTFYFLFFFVGASALLRALGWPLHRRLVTRDTDRWAWRVIMMVVGTFLVSVVGHCLWLVSPLATQFHSFFTWTSAVVGGLALLVGEWLMLKQRQEINATAKQNISTLVLLEADEDDGEGKVDTTALEITEDDTALAEDTAFAQYHGMTYINALFFARVGKRKLRLPYRRLTAILLVATLAILGALWVFRDAVQAAITPAEVANLYETMGPIVVLFYMYTVSMNMGTTFTRLCFFNMDRTMMKNHFYTQPQALRQTINYRIQRLLGYMLPLIAVSVGLLVGSYYLMGGENFLPLVLPLLTVVLGMLFFCFHILYLYYLVQPYTENMRIKSPLYSGLTALGYFLVILLSNVADSLGFGGWLVIYLVMFLYIVLGYLAVIMFAPVRFKLR